MNCTAGHDTTSGYENVLPSLPSARYSADENFQTVSLGAREDPRPSPGH